MSQKDKPKLEDELETSNQTKTKNPESNLVKSVDHLSNTPSDNNRTGLQDFEQNEEAAIQSNISIYLYIYIYIYIKMIKIT